MQGIAVYRDLYRCKTLLTKNNEQQLQYTMRHGVTNCPVRARSVIVNRVNRIFQEYRCLSPANPILLSVNTVDHVSTSGYVAIAPNGK